MTVHPLKTAVDASFDELGEAPLPFAPKITFNNGFSAVPQQYIDVDRTLQSVENILAKISVPDGFLLFAGQIDSVVFIQVAVIGYENYPEKNLIRAVSDKDTELPKKIVYGRRWMLEPTTPTSEVVQTALLAVKKAREHELREHIFWLTQHDDGRPSRTTPFNTHMDLPLMVQCRDSLCCPGNRLVTAADVEQLLQHIRLGELEVKLEQCIVLSDEQCLYRVVCTSEAQSECEFAFSELQDRVLNIVCEPTETAFMHAFFAALLAVSDEFVEQHFLYEQFARFDSTVHIHRLAQFSYQTRNVKTQDPRFGAHFTDMSYRVDASKAPVINQGELGCKQRQALSAYPDLQGYVPHPN